MIRRGLTVLALAALLAPSASYAAEATSGTLPHGGSYVMLSDAAVPTVAIDLWFRAPSAGYDNAQQGLARVAATAAAAATLESGKSLVALVRDLGGRIAISTFPDMTGVTVSAPAGAATKIVAALSAAYFTPAIDADALKAAQRDSAVLSAEHSYSSDDIIHDALFGTIFSSGPAHVPPLAASVNDIASFALTDVKAFAQRAFRSANATIALTGNVDASILDAITAGTPGAQDAPYDSTLASSPKTPATISGLVAGDGTAWAGPPISDPRAATAMDFIADYLFRDETGVVSSALSATGDTYLIGQFITLHDPGIMLVTTSGSDSAATQKRVLDAVTALQQPLRPDTFTAARNAFLYHIASDTQTPVEQADNVGWYAAQGNASYAPSSVGGAYWNLAAGLDPDFVASVARRYLAHPVVVHLQATSTKESSS
jgi:predicted Zn-dependent peptidase